MLVEMFRKAWKVTLLFETLVLYICKLILNAYILNSFVKESIIKEKKKKNPDTTEIYVTSVWTRAMRGII